MTVREHVVVRGDCLSSIAARHGCLWTTLWNLAENAPLREKRRNPNIIYPGDIVFVPCENRRTEEAETERRHRFVKRGTEVELHLRLLLRFEPRIDVPCFFTVDGVTQSKPTDGQGEVVFLVAPTDLTGTLRVGGPESHEAYQVLIGHLDPIETIEGIQERLNNLGFDSGKVDGISGPITQGALKRFQSRYGLPVDGWTRSPATRSKLVDIHGS